MLCAAKPSRTYWQPCTSKLVVLLDTRELFSSCRVPPVDRLLFPRGRGTGAGSRRRLPSRSRHLCPDQDESTLGDALGKPGLRQLAVNNAAGPRRDQAALTISPTRDVEMAAIWIACHPTELRRLPWIDHLYYAITDTISSVRRAVDRLPELAYKGTCDYTEWDGTLQRTCGADLYAERGEDRLYCPKCKTAHDVRLLDRKSSPA